MKLSILALISLIVAVSSKSEKPKTEPVKDQNSLDSAFLQKFLTPLHHNTHERYGDHLVHGDQQITIEELLRNNGYSDYDDHNKHREEHRGEHYGDHHGEHHGEHHLGHHDKIGHLISHSHNEDPSVWEYLRKLGVNNAHHHRQHHGNSRNEGRHGHRHAGQAHHGNKGHGHAGRGHVEYGNDHNIHVPLEPDNIGYIGHVDPHARDIKEKYCYRLIGRRGLGFDRRTASSYGLVAPITPKSLQVVGLRHYEHHPLHQLRV